jgi:phosphonate metabolism protein (transferase hexapeptide repeat family)
MKADIETMPKLSAETPLIHDGCAVVDSQLGRFVEIGQGSRVAHSGVGDYSYCDRMCDIANADIGRFSNIASFVRIGATDHPLDRASLHHFMYRSADYWEDAAHDEDWFTHRKSRRAVIGHDTWIGHNAQIKPEITIGTGAVIASGAIVTKDVPPYAIVAGTPAKIIRFRQPEPIAARLMTLAWWDWDHDRLRAGLEDFRSMSAEAFLEKYE